MKNLKSIGDIWDKLMGVLNSQQKRYGILVLFASFIGAILETLGVSVIIPLINALLTPEELLENEIVNYFYKMFRLTDAGQVVILIGAGIILLYLLKNSFFVLLSWVRIKYSCKVQRELATLIMNNYMTKGYQFFSKQNTSEIMRAVQADTSGVYALLNQLIRLIVESMTILLICIYILVTDWMMALGMAVLAGGCMLVIFGYFKGKMSAAGKRAREYGAHVNQSLIQTFQGIKEVIVMRKQRFFTNQFEDVYQKQQQAFIGYTVGTESPTYIIEAVCIAGLLGMICLRISVGGEEAATMLPMLSAFAVGAFRILPSMGKIVSSFNTILFYIPALRFTYRNIKEVDYEAINIRNTQMENITPDAELQFRDSLIVNHIDWKYEDEADYVLKDLTLEIKKGESVAFIGQSGAGKTTLADIILGLLKPKVGTVELDGRDIFTIGEEWSKVMGYVPQAVYLTDDTLRKNIAFGVKEEDIDDQKVWRALEQAQLKTFVEGLENGLDTMVGERGVRFSGGQSQRVAIARALYENPDILVLDEATAALDNETEKAVMESIEALQGKITLIIIAHRLSTIRKCDRIYEVLERNIVEKKKEDIF